MKNSPDRVLKDLGKKIGTEGIIAFLSVIIIGLATHLTIMTSDIANHDGLDFMYSDENLITSGRWFNKLADGISSFYSLPWLDAVLGFIYLGTAAIFLIKLLRVKSPVIIVLISGMLVTFPSIASNFAYVFTMDGYMLAVLLAVLSVYLVDKHRLGFIFGGIALAFSMGIYQAYLPIAMLLALYMVLMIFGEKNSDDTGMGKAIKTKILHALRYLYMGAIGVALYYILLRVLLLILGKSLTDYQGINDMTSTAGTGILGTVKNIYSDFAAFVLKSKFLFANGFALAAVLILTLAFAAAFVIRGIRRNWFKSFWTYIIAAVSIVIIPVFSNAILIISADVNYHSLMRYQYALFGILALAFIADVAEEYWNSSEKQVMTAGSRTGLAVQWGAVVASVVIVFSYALSDNIAYSNLEKKYEKTYSYCLRLADRIEQTEGYYEGIPIYMIGVVGDDNYPVTDVTEDVTGHMVGISGDYLLYTGENYENFYKYYMGITFNFLDPEEANFYDEDWYVEMPSFPAEGSVKVVDGILVVKTENADRD